MDTAPDRPRSLLDFGPLQSLLDDPAVTEIMVNGAQRIFVERDGRKSRADARFASEAALRTCIERLFAAHGKRIGPDLPAGDVCLADGTRVNAIVAPVARFGMAVTLRKFARDLHTLDDLVARGALSAQVARLLTGCVKGRVNILFSGGTSTGKTTLLQMLSQAFDPQERVVTIEDAAELHLAQDNVVSLETRAADELGHGEVSLRHLIRNALRMAPDRLVIGEVRGPEAVDMIQAMATGHKGTLAVVHGSSPEEVLMRLETMILMSGLSLPLAEVRRMIASTLQLVVHLERAAGNRRVAAVSEVRGVSTENGKILLNDLFRRRTENGPLEAVLHYYPRFYQALKDRGLLDVEMFQRTAAAGLRPLPEPAA